MKFGLFDHLERSNDRPLATQYDERLEFAAAADEAIEDADDAVEEAVTETEGE